MIKSKFYPFFLHVAYAIYMCVCVTVPDVNHVCWRPDETSSEPFRGKHR